MKTAPVPVAVIEELVDHLRAERAQLHGPNGETPAEWFGETTLKGWIEELNTSLGLAGRRPR